MLTINVTTQPQEVLRQIPMALSTSNGRAKTRSAIRKPVVVAAAAASARVDACEGLGSLSEISPRIQNNPVMIAAMPYTIAISLAPLGREACESVFFSVTVLINFFSFYCKIND